MAHSKQAKKRVRTDEKRRLANKSVVSRMRTAVRKLDALIAAGDAEQARAALPKTLAIVDKAAKKGVIHANTASRRKSRVTRAVGRMA